MFDLLFPTQCVNCGSYGKYLCTKCQKLLENSLPECYMCRKISNGYKTHNDCNAFGVDSVFVGWKYNGVAKSILKEYKYKCAYKLSGVLSDLLIARLEQTHFLDSIGKRAVLLPMPVHRAHSRDRGFNQSSLIARDIARRFNLEIVEDLVYRRGKDVYQARLDLEQRKQMRDIFRVEGDIKNKEIIIVDDVLTTGTTLNGVAKLLKGKKIRALILFRGVARYHLQETLH